MAIVCLLAVGDAQRASAVALAIMLLSWLPIALLSHSLWFLILGVITMDFALQAVHVANQSLIYQSVRRRRTG
jgi:hypothetical protein